MFRHILITYYYYRFMKFLPYGYSKKKHYYYLYYRFVYLQLCHYRKFRESRKIAAIYAKKIVFGTVDVKLKNYI